jgi:nascent polypeptide-associated complex subunit alpha
MAGEDKHHDHDHHGHDHHDHDHDHHSHDHHDHSDDEGKGPKQGRAEKKFRKAMMKMGLTEVTGINRVTLRKARAFVISIDDPEILKSPNSETYVIFGKPNINENPANYMASQLGQHKEAQKVEEKVETKVEPDLTEADYSEEGIDQAILKRIMEYTKKPKAVCIKALRENSGDEVNTILALDDNS